MAHLEVMVQPGKVVRRIIHLMAEHRHHGHPFKLAKLYIKYGFWRRAVADENAWDFCYVLTSLHE